MHRHSVRVTLPICDDLSEYHSEDTIILSDSDSEHLQDSAHSHESELAHLSKPQNLALSQDSSHSYKHQDLAQCYNSHDMALSQDSAHSYESYELAHLSKPQDPALSQDLAHSYEHQHPALSQNPAHSYEHQHPAISQDPAHSYEHQDLAQCYDSHDMALSQDPGHSYELQNPVHLGGSHDSCEPCNLAHFDGSQSYHVSASFQVTKDIFTNPSIQVSILERPPYDDVTIGRPISELLIIFRQFRSTEYKVVCKGVFVSKLDMTLAEFCHACKAYCLERHNQNTCQECAHMIIAAGIVQRETICLLSSLFRQAFPNVTYRSHEAKKRLLKIPLACIRVGKPSDGTSQLVDGACERS